MEFIAELWTNDPEWQVEKIICSHRETKSGYQFWRKPRWKSHRVKEKEEWKKKKKKPHRIIRTQRRERIMKYDQLLVKWDQNIGYRSSSILFKGQYQTWNDHFVYYSFAFHYCGCDIRLKKIHPWIFFFIFF